MAETEELQIKVTLVEGNTVEKLREMRKEIEALGGGGTAAQLERFSRQARDAREKGLKPFSEDLEVAAKRMVPFIGGIGGIATGLIAVGYAADKALDALNDFTKVQERIGVLSKQTGFDPAFVKIFQEQFKLSGVEDATRDLQGLSHIMADITRANSEFRRKMMEGQKPGSAEAGAMQQYLAELTEIKDPTKFANKLREGLENIRKNAIAKFGEQRGAEAFRKFETELGMPDLDRLKKDLPEVSAAEKKLQADRQKAADDYLKTSREIDEHWEHIKDAWFDQTLAGSPLMDAMKYIEEVLGRWEKQANKATEIIQQHPSPEGFWNKLNPFDPQVIEQRKALDPGSVSSGPFKYDPKAGWWGSIFGDGATAAPETPAAAAPKRLGLGRPKGGAVPLFGSEWPESTNIEDRRGEAPLLADDALKTQRELMEQTKRLAEDFERLFADYGGGAGLASLGGGGAGLAGMAPTGSLAAQAGLNDIGDVGGVPAMGGLPGGPGTGAGAGTTPAAGGVGGIGRGRPGRGGHPHGSDVGPGTGEGAGETPPGAGAAGVGGFGGVSIPGLGGLPSLGGGRHPGGRGGGRPGRGGHPHGSDVGPGTGEGAGETPAGGDKSLTGNAFLASQRARFRDELEKNPQVRKELAAIMTFEHESDAAAVGESLMNRQAMTGGSISKGLHSGFYGPVNKGLLAAQVAKLERDPKRMARMNAAIEADLAGSNLLKGATDQGSGNDPNVSWPGGKVVRQGETYNDWGGFRGHEYSRKFREAQQEQVNRSRAAIDNGMAQKVEGTGKLSVNVNAPKGTSVNAEGGGLFKKTEVTRQTQMEPAASSMASQYQE